MKAILIFIAILTSLYSYSCTCITLTVKKRVKAYDVIVKAKVLSVEKANSDGEIMVDRNGDSVRVFTLFGYHTTLLIESYYKGNFIQDTMKIAPDESNCELSLVQGETYLIYGQLKDGLIHTSVCSGSRLFEGNSDLNYFRRKNKLKAKKIINSQEE